MKLAQGFCLLLATSLLLAACGGGGDSNTGTQSGAAPPAEKQPAGTRLALSSWRPRATS